MVASVATAASAATALATAHPTNESLTVFESQLDGHRVSTVTLHTKAHTFHILLTDGDKAVIAFPSSQQQQLVNEIEAKGITVKVAKVRPPSHKRRYIAGAIVIVVVLAAVGMLLFIRRRRREGEEGPPPPPAPVR